MGDYSGKRASSEVNIARRGPGIAFRNSNNDDKTVHHCNRLGCSTRLDYMKGTETGNPSKAKKSSRLPFRSTSAKTTVGSTSKSSSSITEFRQSLQDKRNSISQKELEDSDSVSTATSTQTLPSEPDKAASPLPSGLCDTRRRVTSTPRPQQQIRRQPILISQDSSNPLIRRSMSCRNTQAGRTAPHSQGANVQKSGLRNLSCASVSDVLSSGCSSSNSGHYRTTDGIKRRSDGVGSSRRGDKAVTGFSSSANSGSQRRAPSSPGICLNEPSTSQQVLRRTRNGPAGRDGITSVRTRRTHGESALTNPSQSFQGELSNISRQAHGRSGPSNETIDEDGYRRFNIEGIAEDLLDLGEKIGTVSTALTEEALSSCLKRSIYSSATSASDGSGAREDDTKCSICQEEYVIEDEVGDLHCGHRYHVDCVHQWLRQKNWCPICKAEASPS
ncbi:hypothetical protein QJS10_CPB17g00023 [Acorus calamus]|uniref:RING-type E3 ubiquitin transferase n=1 Tax=Acorus calamus TaxID=4465 RepID=A0AAV9CWX3_ACOCL|nr:hypothetical protein QJS10_CPB17g00023 [Acorus calamus]